MSSVNIPEVQYRQRGNNIQYYINVPAKMSLSGKRYQITGKSEEKVINKYLNKIKKETSDYKLLPDDITISELVEIYIDKAAISKTTKSKYYRMYKNHIKDTYFGLLSVEKVRAYHCQEFINSFYDKNLSFGTIKQIKSILSGSFKFAILRELNVHNFFLSITVNPNLCQGKIFGNADSVYNIEELKIIESKSMEAYHHYGLYKNSVILLLLSYTALRIGELLGLRNDNIHLNKKTVVIQNSRKEYTDYKTGRKIRENGKTKNRSSERKIFLNNKAIQWIKELQSRNNHEGIHSEYLICTANGSQPTYNMVYRQLKSFCQYAEVPYHATHIGRRTNISIRIDAGESIASVSASVGHKKQSTTLNSYNKILNVEKAEAVQNKIFDF